MGRVERKSWFSKRSSAEIDGKICGGGIERLQLRQSMKAGGRGTEEICMLGEHEGVWGGGGHTRYKE